MKMFSKVSVIIVIAVFMFGLAGLAIAATTVNLGTAGNFAILAGSGITNTGSTTITGDVGTFPTTTETGFGSVTLNGTNQAGNAVTQGAKNDLVTAYDNAAGQTPVTVAATELGGTTKTAGVYVSDAGTFGITGTLTLDAQGDPDAVFIFKANSTLITASASEVRLINSAQACHVFWQVGSSATLGTRSTFKGSILALTSVTLTTSANVDGRVLARNGAVTMDTNTIAESTCAGASSTTGTLHIVKNVTNDSGGSATASDFNLHVKLSGTDVSGSPAAGTASPGTSYSLAAGTYAVSEDSFPSYTQSFSGDCNSTGSVTLAAGEDKTCTITNNDTGPTPSNPATLHVIKKVTNDDGGDATASDFTLYVKISGDDISGSPAAGAASPGTSYSLAAGTYTVSEDEDDSYAQSFSGDCNSTGSVTLAEGEEKTCTITNNDDEEDEDDEDDEEDEDVGIKVTKEANPSALHSGPGSVTFTYKVTNEGDVSLKDISVKDDMCSPVVYVSGRKNKDGRLDKNEKWKYSCTKTVSQTETNKATASGTANGEKVHDHAKATVTVSSVPGLPNAGIGPENRGSNAPWNSIIPIGMLVAALFSVFNSKEAAISDQVKH